MTFEENGVTKKILYPGKYITTFENGAKVTFHFQCNILKKGEEDVDTLLDDSRKTNRPMELIIGKQFKMPVWEACLKSMMIGEVSQFHVDKMHATAYPTVSRSYRQFAGISQSSAPRTCCAMTAFKEGTGDGKLDGLLQEPKNLQFIFELLKVEQPGEYEKESWSMTPEEKLMSVPQLKEDGNNLYKCKNYKDAAAKYSEALGRLEQLMLREKPEEEEWLELEKLKFPILLNYAQCKLVEKDYYPVIEYTSDILGKDPDNVKALFKRAKSYVGIWDLQSARADFLRIMDLDTSLQNAVKKELGELNVLQKQKDTEDKAKFLGKLF